MYKYDPVKNELIEIPETSFQENNILERDNIEEWVRKNPEILGEELLIIGHEYDKFDISDRLDLLAVDKEGKLVVIETKRDKSGSEVDFQCLKYCSYCSQLKPQDVIDIFIEYLNKNKINKDAKELIIDFLELPSGNEDTINEMLNNSQRFIIIGKEIDKRILSVSAWLFENGIDVKCITIKPFKDSNNEIYVDIDQIIPPFKINDYFIQKKENKKEDATIYQSDYIINFFQYIVEYVQTNSNLKINYSPRKSYCNVSSGKSINYTLGYLKRDNTFTLHAVIKDATKKEKFAEFYQLQKDKLEELFSNDIQFQPEGERNPDWSYIKIIIKNEDNEELKNNRDSFGDMLIKFSDFFNRNWN
jgi:Endonuclease NucS C-terminal domain